MGEKKYTSGKAVTAEIERLLKIRNNMISSKTEVFMKALLTTKDFSKTIVDMKDSDIKKLAKAIGSNFKSLIRIVNNVETKNEENNESQKADILNKDSQAYIKEDEKNAGNDERSQI